jgi:Protein of unknown function (DUF2934)
MGVEAKHHTEIAQRAHFIWELEGCPNGRDLDHWLRAEAEFNAIQNSLIEKRKPAKRRGSIELLDSVNAGFLKNSSRAV